MIKIFTTNQNGKIEFTEQELLDFVEEIKLECKERERHRINPATSSVPPSHPIQTITPYRAIKSDVSANDVGIREDKGDIFAELLKELGY